MAMARIGPAHGECTGGQNKHTHRDTTEKDQQSFKAILCNSQLQLQSLVKVFRSFTFFAVYIYFEMQTTVIC